MARKRVTVMEGDVRVCLVCGNRDPEEWYSYISNGRAKCDCGPCCRKRVKARGYNNVPFKSLHLDAPGGPFFGFSADEIKAAMRLRKNAIARCENKNHKNYADYGGRGITFFPPWKDPVTYAWFIHVALGPRPPGLTMNRIDNDLGYIPGNLEYATRTQQNRNQRKTKRFSWKAEKLTIMEIVEMEGLDPRDGRACDHRLKRGWSPEKTFTAPIKHPKPKARAAPAPPAPPANGSPRLPLIPLPRKPEPIILHKKDWSDDLFRPVRIPLSLMATEPGSAP